MSTTFPVLRVAEVTITQQHRWLIQDLWTDQAVGILGGPAKACKSWLGLEMALSVASGVACLGRFPVRETGRVLVYMAEDALPAVRERVQALCHARDIDMSRLELYLIDTPSIRLDLEDHQTRLRLTIDRLKPKLLLLDPLVRLHRSDENSAMEMARVLGFLRELQRTFSLALVLVHHTSKKHQVQLGQALRGSSDIHAWTDSSLFLQKKGNSLILSGEHRSAPAPQPLVIKLAQTARTKATHLEVVRTWTEGSKQRRDPLDGPILELLNTAEHPLTRHELRHLLKVKNQTLGLTLAELEQKGLILREPNGWIVTTPPETDLHPENHHELAHTQS